MAAYMSVGGNVLTIVRTEFRVDLRDLTFALYSSNHQTGVVLTNRTIRQDVAHALAEYGNGLCERVSTILSDYREYDADEVNARLEWARRMIIKAYRDDFAAVPGTLAAFKALPVEEIS
jgi:hypothetical protein